MGVAGVTLAAVVLSACGSGADAGHPAARAAGQAVPVVASFYPLEYVARRVGGEHVSVTNLTPPGAEPHDVELTPRQVARVEDADLAVYLRGFAPAVDDAVAQGAPGHAFDVGPVAQLEAHPEAEGGPTGTDPHFWLDPLRLAAVGDALAARLGDLDPTNAATFAANAATLRTDLQALDEELRAGLASCANRLLVTSHAAFGYFAERYGLEQHAITDLTPEAEPTPESLAAIADFVRANGVTTIYSETLVSPAVAKAVAGESGARVAVLDPIEGLAADAAATTDYFSIMRTNLATLRAGQPCP